MQTNADIVIFLKFHQLAPDLFLVQKAVFRLIQLLSRYDLCLFTDELIYHFATVTTIALAAIIAVYGLYHRLVAVRTL